MDELRDDRFWSTWRAPVLGGLLLAGVVLMLWPSARERAERIDRLVSEQEAEIRKINADRLRRRQELEAARVEFANLPEVVRSYERAYAEAEPALRAAEDAQREAHLRAIRKLLEP